MESKQAYIKKYYQVNKILTHDELLNYKDQINDDIDIVINNDNLSHRKQKECLDALNEASLKVMHKLALFNKNDTKKTDKTDDFIKSFNLTTPKVSNSNDFIKSFNVTTPKTSNSSRSSNTHVRSAVPIGFSGSEPFVLGKKKSNNSFTNKRETNISLLPKGESNNSFINKKKPIVRKTNYNKLQPGIRYDEDTMKDVLDFSLEYNKSNYASSNNEYAIPEIVSSIINQFLPLCEEKFITFDGFKDFLLYLVDPEVDDIFGDSNNNLTVPSAVSIRYFFNIPCEIDENYFKDFKSIFLERIENYPITKKKNYIKCLMLFFCFIHIYCPDLFISANCKEGTLKRMMPITAKYCYLYDLRNSITRLSNIIETIFDQKYEINLDRVNNDILYELIADLKEE